MSVLSLSPPVLQLYEHLFQRPECREIMVSFFEETLAERILAS